MQADPGLIRVLGAQDMVVASNFPLSHGTGGAEIACEHPRL